MRRLPGGTRATVGGRGDYWEDVLECRARASHRSSREFEVAAKSSAAMTHLLVIRADARLEPLDLASLRVRILRTGAVLQILHAADPNWRRREIHIHAREAK